MSATAEIKGRKITHDTKRGCWIYDDNGRKVKADALKLKTRADKKPEKEKAKGWRTGDVEMAPRYQLAKRIDELTRQVEEADKNIITPLKAAMENLHKAVDNLLAKLGGAR